MPSIEIFLLLLFIGAATGSMSAVIKIAPTLIAIPTLYFFSAAFNLPFQGLMLPAIATCIAAFIPAHLYAWITSMKRAEVDTQYLINFAPGVAMGGVIGAQLLSLSSLLVFKVAFSLISLIAVLNIAVRPQLKCINTVRIGKSVHLPIGLFVGVLSLLSGNCGRVLGSLLCSLKKVDQKQHQGTSDGFVVFASIAALVGFIYPAQSFDHMNMAGFAGAVHLPSMVVLACSHFFFYWLCRNLGNDLDKRVLSISFVVFITCSLIRIWVT
jgi:uncharacterized membrane protein YfcA